MSYPNAHQAYQQASVRGASPVGQVVALYDRILRDLHEARKASEAGNVEMRVHALNHALTIIEELRSVLDFERGGAAARQLKNFYELTRILILQTSVAPSAPAFEKLIALYTPVRQAWAQVETVGPAGQTNEMGMEQNIARAGVSGTAAPPPEETETHGQGGMWRG